MTPLIVTPALAKKVRNRIISAVAVPLHLPKAEDTFCEIVHNPKDNFIRIYFNNYQVGFNFCMTGAIGFKEDYAKAPSTIYASDGREDIHKWFPAIAMPLHEIRDIYPVKGFEVVRREDVPQVVGCFEYEVKELYPSLKQYPFALIFHLLLAPQKFDV